MLTEERRLCMYGTGDGFISFDSVFKIKISSLDSVCLKDHETWKGPRVAFQGPSSWFSATYNDCVNEM